MRKPEENPSFSGMTSSSPGERSAGEAEAPIRLCKASIGFTAALMSSRTVTLFPGER